MPKNIVVFSDGTGQDGGARPEQRISNIYKMYRISHDHADTAIDPSQQVVFYDAGLGTDIGTTALTAPVRFVQKLQRPPANRSVSERDIKDVSFRRSSTLCPRNTLARLTTRASALRLSLPPRNRRQIGSIVTSWNG
jgi:hypothetical protein